MNQQNYFDKVSVILILSIGLFLVLKTVLPKRLFPDNKADSTSIVIDSLALNAMADAEKSTIDSLSTSTQLQTDIDSMAYQFSATKKMEGHANIINFYDKLYRLEKDRQPKDKLRIAYFSDSMTDGDLIVQDIRSLFQNKYGGEGVGFVGITSLSARSRYSVEHNFSNNWITNSFIKKAKKNTTFGIDGQVSFCRYGEKNTLDYRANDLKNCTKLDKATLFFGRANNNKGQVKILIDSDSVRVENLNPKELLNTQLLSSKRAKKVKLEFSEANAIPFYGVNFDDGKGIHIDNFSIRGNSGLPLTTLDKDLMQAFNKEFNYDLIILHYGTNIVGYGTTDFRWYEEKMTNVIQHFKECFPSAKFLVVSVADKSSKQDLEMATDKAIEPLIKSQRRFAETNKTAFINLFLSMGGRNSMVDWVEKTPRLANKDYTHFNVAGSKKIGTIIYDELNSGYQKYKQLKGISTDIETLKK